MLKAVTLDKRVVCQAPTVTFSDERQPVTNWSTYATRWANIKPLSSSEKEKGDGIEATGSYEITFRLFATIKHNDRLTNNGTTYNILSVTHDANEEITKCVCGVTEDA